MTAAISKPTSSNIVDIAIHTHKGDQYHFPAMDKSALSLILPKGENRLPSNTPSLSLVNVSSAVICILFSTIKTIIVGDEVWWENPTA